MTANNTTQIINSVPSNTNLLYTNRFKFTISFLPKTTYFCSAAKVPGLSLTAIDVNYAIGRVPVSNTKLAFNEFSMTFKVDEDLRNYAELYNWFIGIGMPESTDQFASFLEARGTSNDQYNIYSDATLLTLTNATNYNVNLRFIDLFPLTLSDIDFDDTQNVIQTATASFRYLRYIFQ